jgi:MFS family permease
VALAAVTVAAALLTEGSFNNFLSLYTRTLFGSGVGAAAAVVALVAIAALIGRLVAGAVVRRFGERRTVGLAGAVTAAGLLLGTAGDEPMIAVAGLAAVAFGLSPVVPTAMSLAARSAPGESGRSVGVVGGVGYGALVGGPVVIGLLAEATGLRVAIGALIVAALTIAYAGLRWPPHPGAIDPEGSGQ